MAQTDMEHKFAVLVDDFKDMWEDHMQKMFLAGFYKGIKDFSGTLPSYGIARAAYKEWRQANEH